MVMLASGCATSGAAISDFCAVARPIFISVEDRLSDLTARQILDHNEKGAAMCAWKK
jgi:hypothetical protein